MVNASVDAGERHKRLQAGRRKWEGSKRRFLVVVKEKMQLIGLTQEDAKDWVKWKQMICYDDQ